MKSVEKFLISAVLFQVTSWGRTSLLIENKQLKLYSKHKKGL